MCYRKRNFRKSHQHVRNRLSFGIFQPANGKIPYEVLLYQLLLPQQMRPIQEEKSAGICGCCTHCNVLRNSKIHVNEVSYCGKPRHMHSPTLSIRSCFSRHCWKSCLFLLTSRYQQEYAALITRNIQCTGFLGVQYYLMGNVPRHLMCSKV